MVRVFAKGSRYWDNPTPVKSVEEVIRNYESGLAGAFADPQDSEDFTRTALETGGYQSLEEAATTFKWYGNSKGKLVIPYTNVIEAYPGCWPGPNQERGDCVAHDTRNAILGTAVCEVVAQNPDEVSGVLERLPEVPEKGVGEGVFATEPLYWYRGHGGDGWTCEGAAKVAIEKCGAIIRKNYPEQGYDFTEYNARLAGEFGRRPPGLDVTDFLDDNRIRTAARVNSFQGISDALYTGRFISSCGGESWSKTRDEFGFSERTRAGWAHAMAYIAADSRPVVVKKYGEALVLILNSWGSYWNKGGRDIIDSARLVPSGKKALWVKLDLVNPKTGNIMIPKGAFWARASDITRRRALAFVGLNGWTYQPLESFTPSIFG